MIKRLNTYIISTHKFMILKLDNFKENIFFKVLLLNVYNTSKHLTNINYFVNYLRISSFGEMCNFRFYHEILFMIMY